MKQDRRAFPASRISLFGAFLLLGLAFFSGGMGQTSEHPPVDPHLPRNFVGKNGMVVAAHPLAAEAGLDMLKKGGNAVDAAIATAFALNAAEPFASGIGGGGFIVIFRAKEKQVKVINFREKAPAGAYPTMFEEKGDEKDFWRTNTGLAVAVPGALAGWTLALEKYGTRPLSDVTQRAIEIAERGYEVSLTFSSINKDEYEKLAQNAGEDTCYLNGGFPFEPGDSFRNPDLAASFRIIAAKGAKEFYKGDIARKIVDAVQAHRGIITLEDLASYRAIEQEPLKGTYKDFTLYSLAPPGSGGLHVIQLLRIIENWPVKEWGHNSVAYIHHISEALRFIFADRERYLGDPDFISIPIDKFLSNEYASRVISLIKPDRLADSYPFSRWDEREHHRENTTHVCVADKDGNIVSLTQSINHFFGSGIIPEGTGFLLNNHMDDFSDDPASVNAPNSNRRPVSSMGPLIMFKKESPYLVLGSPGGTRIFPSLAQIILNTLEFGMSLDEAIEAPRFFTYSSNGKARSLSVESRLPEVTVKKLEEIGHKITIREAYDKYFGGAQGIMILKDKALILGGADSRRDGFGAGY